MLTRQDVAGDITRCGACIGLHGNCIEFAATGAGLIHRVSCMSKRHSCPVFPPVVLFQRAGDSTSFSKMLHTDGRISPADSRVDAPSLAFGNEMLVFGSLAIRLCLIHMPVRHALYRTNGQGAQDVHMVDID